MSYQLETARVILRQWQAPDYSAFAAMNADSEVMRFFPKLLSTEESDTLTRKFEMLIANQGWGFWVAQRKSDGAFMGLVGLNHVSDLPISDCMEVGWRLAELYWGHGYVTEAALASLHFAFDILAQSQVVAFTATINSNSRSVMRRLGMKNREENFQHPKIAEGSELREHVVYEIDREAFYENFERDSVIISST